MGLFGGFGISQPPCMVMELIGNNGLPAFIHMDMADNLFIP
jgi:hypothetical protein